MITNKLNPEIQASLIQLAEPLKYSNSATTRQPQLWKTRYLSRLSERWALFLARFTYSTTDSTLATQSSRTTMSRSRDAPKLQQASEWIG